MPTFVSGTATANTSGTVPLTITAPSGIVAGNLLLAVVGANSGTVSSGTPTWTLVDSHSGSSQMTLWSRTATSSEPSSYTWTGANWLAGCIVQYNAAAIDGSAVWGDFSASPATIPASGTPTTAADTWLSVVYTNDGATLGTPTGMSPRASAAQSGLDGISAWDAPLSSATATGTNTSTVTPNDSGSTLTLLLKSTADVVFAAGRDTTSTHTLMGSVDGISWHLVANPNDSRPTFSSAYGIAGDGAGHYVLCGLGNGGTTSATNAGVICYSSDGGVTFTAEPSEANNIVTGTSTRYGGGNAAIWCHELSLWLCAATDGGDTLSILSSPDGLTWTTRHNPLDGGWCSQIGWNGSLAVAVGSNAASTATIISSPDGITWTAHANPFDGDFANGIWWDGTLWIAIGETNDSSVTIATSPNGTTWTARHTPFEGTGTNGASGSYVCGDGAGTLVAIGKPNPTPGPVICTSIDHGATWTAQTTPFDPLTNGTSNSQSITWSAALGLWIMGAQNGTRVPHAVLATSPDAVTWTIRTTSFDNPTGTSGAVSFGGLLSPPVMGGTPFQAPFLAFGTDGVGGAGRLLEKNNATTGAWSQVHTGWDGGGTAYGNQWMIGGQDGNGFPAIATSADGVSWSSTPTPYVGTDIEALAYNGSQWVAGGQATSTPGRLLMTSPDGVSWTFQVTPYDGAGEVRTIIWDGSQWVVGLRYAAHSILTSPDGITWTPRTTPFDGTTATWGVYGLAFHAGTYVAVGQHSTFAQTIATSTDAITWTARSNPLLTGGSGLGNSVVWTGTQWVVGGECSSGTVVVTSTDGTTWTARTTVLDGGEIVGLGWNGSLLVGAGWKSGVTTLVITSPDAATWTARTTPVDSTSNSGWTVGWSAALSQWAVGVSGPSGHMLVVSSNGTTWTAPTTVLDNGSAFGVAYGPGGRHVPSVIRSGLFVDDLGLYLFGGSGPPPNYRTILTTSDLHTWSEPTQPLTNGAKGVVNALVWTGSLLVAGGQATISTDPVLATSPDGVTWTAHSSPMDGDTVTDIAWNGTAFLAVGHTPANVAAGVTSTDGLTWTSVTLSNLASFPGTVPTSVCWDATISKWVVGLTQSGVAIMTSGPTFLSDGSNWAGQNTGLGRCNQVRFLKDHLVATGLANLANVNVSTDGATWTNVTVGVGQTGESLFWDNSHYWLGADGATFKSSDGSTWTASPGLLDTGQVLGFATGVAPGGATPPPAVVPHYIGTPGIIPIYDASVSPGPTFAGKLFVSGQGVAKFESGTWSSVTTPWDGDLTGNWWGCGVWAGPPINKYFIGGFADNLTGVPVVMSSPDGVTWSNATTPLDGSTATSYVETIIWTGSMLVAVGAGAGTPPRPTIATSTDGTTWTSRTSGLTADCYDVAWNGSKFLAVGFDASSHGVAAFSTDGITWTAVTTIPWSTSGVGLYGCAWHAASGVWVIVGPVANQCLTSPDGVTWTVRTLPLNGATFVRSFNNQLMAVSSSPLTANEPLATSPDGITWTARAVPPATGVGAQYAYWDGLTWWAGLFNGPGTNLVSSADNGATWTPRTAPNSTTGNISGIWAHGTPQPPALPTPPSGGPLTFVSGNTALQTATTSIQLTIPAPASIVAGNLLVAIIGTTGSAGVLAPMGWSSVIGGGSGTDGLNLFTAVASTGEPAQYTFPFASGTASAAGAIVQYSGASGVDNAGAAADILAFPAGTTATAPSETPLQTGDAWVTAFYGHGSGFSNPAGQVTKASTALSGASLYVFGIDNYNSTAPTGTATSNLSVSDHGLTLSMLLKQGTTTIPSPPPPEFPLFVSASTVDQSGGLTGANHVTVPAPAGLVTGNTLIAVVVAENTTVTTLTGWTYQSNIGGFYILTHTVGGSEPSSYTFNFGAAASGWAGTILQYSGVGAGVVDGFMALNQWSSGSASVNASSISSSFANDMALAVFYDGGGAYSIPIGMTPLIQGSGTSTRMAAFQEILTTVGSTAGTVNSTLTPTGYGFGVVMYLHP